MPLLCILLLCTSSVASSSRVFTGDRDGASHAQQEGSEVLNLEDLFPGSIIRGPWKAGRSASPIMKWDYQAWMPSSQGPSVLLGREMGPFSGGRRVLSRYAGHALPEQSRSILIEKDVGSYSALFNEDTKTSDAVYYTVDSQNFERGGGRGNGWATSEDMREVGKQDEEFVALHAKHSYLGVGHLDLDRGHQAPVAAFNGNLELAQSTNQAENLTPQNARLNQGNWKKLEEAERRLASSGEKNLHILTGPLYNLPQGAVRETADDWEDLLQKWCGSGVSVDCEDPFGLGSSHLNDMELRFNGKNEEEDGIRIPLGYFKVIADPEDKAVAGFIMDQTGGWWPMAGLPGVEAVGREALTIPSLELPEEFYSYDPRNSADLATELAEKLLDKPTARQAPMQGLD